MTVETAPIARRSLKMHTKLLHDVISRQAGTLDKAILEGVMNAIEAGAKTVQIAFAVDDAQNATLEIKDDGKGITSAKEIEMFFETFGQPHDASEGKIWAAFRMGRGQMFSYGRNHWRTGQFAMVVDIANEKMGLDYDLQSDLDEVVGCDIKINLYRNPIGNSYNSISSLKDAIKRQIAYMPTPVFFNGEKLNAHPKDLNWTEETDDAYYLFGTGLNLTVYNMGALVRSYNATDMGTIGIIVSKKQLKVNFARNDIQSDCLVWDRMKKIIKKYKIEKRERKQARRFDSYERISCLKDIRDGEQDWREVRNIGLLMTANDRSTTLDFMRKNRQPWSFAKMGNSRADKLMVRNSAMVLDESILDELGYPADADRADFFTWLVTNDVAEFEQTAKRYDTLDNLAREINDTYKTFSAKELTVPERYLMRLLNGSGYNHHWNGREIRMGAGPALAWTNGSTYIVLDREFVRGLNLPGSRGVSQLMHVLCHEMTHDNNTAMSHVHGEEFYRRFHDLLVYNNNACQLMSDFHYRWTRSKTDERAAKVIAKEELVKARLEAKLGVNKVKEENEVPESVAACTATEDIEASVDDAETETKPAKKTKTTYRRRPLGAMME